jgi:hypothetical protein
MQRAKQAWNSCPICEQKTSQRMQDIASYYFCPHCLFGWLKTPPEAVYTEQYYRGESSLFSKLFYPLQLFFYSLREGYAGKGIKKLWVDVGAGEGNFLASVKAQEKIGVEVSKDGILLMKEKKLGTLSDTQFLKTKGLDASVITFWHMLEHVETPRMYIQAAYKNLAKNGRIIIGVPNNQSLEFRIFGKDWFHLAPKFHIMHFSPHAMTLLLTQEKFRVERIDFWSPEHHVSGLLQSCINKTATTKDILHKLLKRSDDAFTPTIADIFSVVLWCSIGLFPIGLFFMYAAITKQSGTFVLIARKDKR